MKKTQANAYACWTNLRVQKTIFLDLPGIFSTIQPIFRSACWVSVSEQFVFTYLFGKIVKIPQNLHSENSRDDCSSSTVMHFFRVFLGTLSK